jgi:hypothetical protein
MLSSKAIVHFAKQPSYLQIFAINRLERLRFIPWGWYVFLPTDTIVSQKKP